MLLKCLFIGNNLNLAGESVHIRVIFPGRDLFHSDDIKPLNKREFVFFKPNIKAGICCNVTSGDFFLGMVEEEPKVFCVSGDSGLK